MNLSCSVAFVTNLPDTTSITMITILHGILMMVILLAMILTKQTSRRSRIASEVRRRISAKNRLLFRTVPACRTTRQNCTVQNTMQSYYSGKARGQDTVHSTVPHAESLKSLFAFGGKESTLSKSRLLSMISSGISAVS